MWAGARARDTSGRVIRLFFRGCFSLVGLVVAAYVFFAVPLGERTLYEHFQRIAATEEAKELGRDVEVAKEKLEEKVRKRFASDASSDAVEPDQP